MLDKAGEAYATKRELEILEWIAEGKTADEISIILGIAHHTITTHKTALMQKFDAYNSPALVAKAFRLGILK